MPLRAALAHFAQTQPDKLAVSIDARSVSFRDLYERSQRLDGFLAALERQERSRAAVQDVPLIAIHLGNHAALPELLAAALAGSCCVMLLDPLLPEATVQATLDRLPPDALFTASGDATFNIKAPIFSVTSHDSLDPLIAAGTIPSKPPSPTDPFMVAFTSGTTSTPKAFARDRTSWQRSLARGHTHFATHTGLSTLAPGPLVHGLSLYALAETLHAGASFHAMGKFSAEGVASIVASEDIKRMVCVPTMLEALSVHGAHLPQLSQITTAGAKLNPDLLVKTRGVAPSAEITEYYGASELGFVTTVTHHTDNGDAQSVGPCFPEVEIDIRSPDEDGNGEVWVKSDLIIEDYLWRDDDRGFRREGNWSTVGDIGRMIGGALHLTSRAGGMVTSGGNNIYLEEVAAHLRRHPAIQDAVVLGIADRYLGTKLVAIVSGVSRLEHAKLLRHCQTGLQKYKIPRDMYRVSDWPMTSSGKIATGQLEAWIEEKDDRLAPL